MRASWLPRRWGAVGGLAAAAVFVTTAPATALVMPVPGTPLAARATMVTAAHPAGDGRLAAPSVRLRGAELVNASTGALLWGKEINVSRPMGSITKVMTALLVLRAGDLDRKIKVTRGAVRYVHKDGASSAGLIAGDVLTTRDLLKAMLIPSGCDAAYLLAGSYGPGRRAFVSEMNAAAQAMGLTGTHFTSFDGMPYPTEHSTYSTPADLIRLGELAMRHPVFRRIVAMRSFRLAAAPGHHGYLWQTTNELLGFYRGAIGIKTGNTNAAGNCLLFEVRRGSGTLIGVVLHADPTDRWDALFTAARRMLNWGFRRL
jgi:serine-type D-Ala-D-Ala carboxypeptidase (penicillin-binding protein 5/6)